ncbi:response regulator [Thalassospiraceae bacterium LMO-JJ14]|nr:response regulator [Thalassospiraceae bacterium LMO-JJ14]
MSGYDFETLKVLVADDSRPMRSLIKSFLLGFGVKEMFEAADANEAYDEVKNEEPDIVITDWRMPPTDGLDLVKQIRMDLDSPNPYLPVIMLTGFTELHRVKQARDAGVTAFLAKPISAAALYRRLCTVIDDQRPFVRVGEFFGPDRRARRRTEPYMGTERRRDAQ